MEQSAGWLLDEEQFQAYLEVAPDPKVVVGADGRVLLVNHLTEEIFGYPRAELIGQFVEMLLPARFRERHRDHRMDFIDQPRVRAMGEGLELLGVRKDGTEFPVDISLGPVTTSQGTVTVAAVRDATERKRLEAASRDLAEARRRHRQGLELNDRVVQGLTAASMAIELGETERATELLASTLEAARHIVGDLLGDHEDLRVSPGDLIRSQPADLRRDPT